MAPLPKPPGARQRRNSSTSPWRQLPAAGRAGKAPTLPPKRPAWLKQTRDWWATIWKSPMATAWEPADVDGLLRLARLRDDFDRGTLAVSALRAMQALEDRYGLNPKSRQQMLWQIDRDEAPRPPAPSSVTRLRAV